MLAFTEVYNTQFVCCSITISFHWIQEAQICISMTMLHAQSKLSEDIYPALYPTEHLWKKLKVSEIWPAHLNQPVEVKWAGAQGAVSEWEQYLTRVPQWHLRGFCNRLIMGRPP